MKQIIILGNWKSNKTLNEAKQWIEKFKSLASVLPSNIRLILCPAFHHLDLFANAKLPLSLGVQDVSPFPSGAYTGAMSARMLEGTVEYTLLGHSERRKYFGETDETIAKKVTEAKDAGIKPIVCISQLPEASRLKELVPDFADFGMLLYEPLFAIGSGQSDTPDNADKTAKQLQDIIGTVPVLYGGSVIPENVAGFVQKEHLAGVGVGGASLDPEKFYRLIEAASHAA